MSLIDQINNRAKEEAERKRKRFLDQRNKFYENVTETQQKTGAGVYGKYSKEYTETREGKIVKSIGKEKGYTPGDVRTQAIKEAEARVEAERQYYHDQNKGKGLTAGQQNKDGSRVLSATGERPKPPTEQDIQKRLPEARKHVDEIRKEQQQAGRKQRVPSQDPIFVAYRGLKKEAAKYGYDINRGKVKQYVETEADGTQVEYTQVSAKYTPSKESVARDKATAQNEQQAAINAELAKITVIPGFSGYNVTYDKEGTARINYTLGETKQGLSISAEPTARQQTEEEFLASQRAKGLYFTGEKSTDPITGQTVYQFSDHNARDKALREAATKEKVLKANAAYIGYKTVAEYDKEGNVIGYLFEPRKGSKQSEVYNDAGTNVTSEFLRGEIPASYYSKLSFKTPEDAKIIEPNLGQQVYRSTVGFGGELVAGIIDLAGAGQVRIAQGLGIISKEDADARIEGGLQNTQKIRDATSLDALGNFQIAVGEATGNRAYIYEGITSKHVSKHAPPPVVDPLIGAGGGLAEVFGTKEGKELRETFVEQTQKRPLETAITTAFDYLTFGGTGALRSAGASVRGASAVGKAGKVASETFRVSKVGKLKENPVTESLRITEEPIKNFKNERIDLGSGIVKSPSEFKNISIKLGEGTGKVVKKDDYGYGGYGKGKGKGKGSGGSAEKPKDYSEKPKSKRTESGATYTYTSKEGSLLLEEKVEPATVKEEPIVQTQEPTTTSEPIDIPEGYLPPEEQTVVGANTLGLGDSDKVLAARRLAQEKRDRTERIKKTKERLKQDKQVRFGQLTKLKGRERQEYFRNLGRQGTKGKLKGQERTVLLQERQVALTELQRTNQKPKLKAEQVRITVTKPVQQQKQIFDVVRVPRQSFKRTTKQVQKTSTLELEKTITRTRTDQKFGEGFRQLYRERTPTTGKLEVPRNIPRVGIPLIPRGGGGGSILAPRSGKRAFTDISNLSTSNILAPEFSIVGSDKGSLEYRGAKSHAKKGRKKRRKSILEI